MSYFQVIYIILDSSGAAVYESSSKISVTVTLHFCSQLLIQGSFISMQNSTVAHLKVISKSTFDLLEGTTSQTSKAMAEAT